MTRVRVIVAASAACLAVAAAGCGSSGEGADPEQLTQALTSLYAIDHDGASPAGDAVAPYEAAFRRVQEGCQGTPTELADGIVDVADQASNGSGTEITNLDVLLAVVRDLRHDRQDCAGLLVGVEARLEGAALEG